MKVFSAEVASILAGRGHQPRLRSLSTFLIVLLGLVCTYAAVFKWLMAGEGREYSWVTAFYWVLTVMSTLGFGDITFHTDEGRLFSMLVLASGMLFLLILLPFLFIEFFYEPFMAAQSAARTRKSLPKDTRDHVLLTHFDELSAALIRRLPTYKYKYCLLTEETEDALRLAEHDLEVVVGQLDSADTYDAVRASQAALMVLTGPDTVNANIAATVRERHTDLQVISLADDDASIDLLELAGCSQVIHMPSLMAQAFVRRVSGGDCLTHTVGTFDDLEIAEANAAATPLVGQTLREANLRAATGANAIGVWERGRFEPARPETKIADNTVLLLAGDRRQLDSYDRTFGDATDRVERVLILGGGRVGRAAAEILRARSIDYRIVERDPSRPGQDHRWVIGNAADLEVLKKAGIDEATTLMISTHNDDTNIYLTLYGRKLRPEIQILSRSTRDRNVTSLHRAGADFVLSYSTMGANLLLNTLERSEIVAVAEGLFLFRLPVPRALAGKTLADSAIRAKTGASVVAVESEGTRAVNPDPSSPLPAGGRLILIGNREAERAFLAQYPECAVAERSR